MKKKAAAFVLALSALLGIPLLTAPAASATSNGYGSCSAGAWTFDGTTSMTGGTLTNYRIAYRTSTPTGLEWRARVYSLGGALLYDSGYLSSSSANAVSRNPNAYIGGYGNPVNVVLNMGRWNDGLPTCQVSYFQYTN